MIKRLLVVICLCLLMACSISQFDQINVIRNHFEGSVHIHTLPIYNGHYLVKEQNGDVWFILMQTTRILEKSSPRIISKAKIVFDIKLEQNERRENKINE